MSVIFRLKDIEVDGYYFIGYEGLLWHSGKFWFNEQEVKQLRKLAKPCKIKLLKEVLPF